ncbi:MAG: MotA/TolQ/ExbB proton channel family protein [Candidatus Alcyoniella australis]|nr:MotA/TolQ/ExbB proton channel family protein [Candidatus Alcyoniella australis]
MRRSEQLKVKIKQLNVWVIAVSVAVLIIVSLFKQQILDSTFLAEYIVPGVHKLGLLTIFALYVMVIIMIVDWAYLSLFKLTRPRYYDPEQRDELIKVLRDPSVMGDIDAFRKRTADLVTHYGNYLSEIISAVLPSAIKQPFMLEQYFRVKVENINGRHADGINMITLLSGLGPIVGFFGTLLGLIQAFHVSSVAMLSEGQMTPDTFAQLQTSLMIAIITSAFGIVIRIMGSIMRHHLLSKMNNISDEIHGIPMAVMYESGA